MKFFKIITIFITLILGAKTASNIGFFEILKSKIYREARELIHKKNYKKENILIFKTHQLRNAVWNGNDEFSLYGNYYDVAEVRMENGQKIYLCLKDGKDEMLDKAQKIAAAFTIKNQTKDFIPWSKTAKCLVKNFTAIISPVYYSFNGYPSYIFNKNFNSTLKIYSFSKVFIPPPEQHLI